MEGGKEGRIESEEIGRLCPISHLVHTQTGERSYLTQSVCSARNW